MEEDIDPSREYIVLPVAPESNYTDRDSAIKALRDFYKNSRHGLHIWFETGLSTGQRKSTLCCSNRKPIPCPMRLNVVEIKSEGQTVWQVQHYPNQGSELHHHSCFAKSSRGKKRKRSSSHDRGVHEASPTVAKGMRSAKRQRVSKVNDGIDVQKHQKEEPEQTRYDHPAMTTELEAAKSCDFDSEDAARNKLSRVGERYGCRFGFHKEKGSTRVRCKSNTGLACPMRIFIRCKEQGGDGKRKFWRIQYTDLEHQHNHPLTEEAPQTWAIPIALEQNGFESRDAARDALNRIGKSW